MNKEMKKLILKLPKHAQECIKKAEELNKKIQKDFKVTETIAGEAIELACEFNLEDESDMITVVSVIIATMKHTDYI